MENQKEPISIIKERRETPRLLVGPNQKTFIEIDVPFPKNTKLVKEVLDLSFSGLSFRMAHQEGFFLPGTPLQKITINYGKEKIKTNAEVAHITNSHLPTSTEYKVGINFLDRNKKGRTILGKNVIDTTFRPLRFSKEDFPGIIFEVEFKLKNRQYKKGIVSNFSRYGLSFQFKKEDFKFKKGFIFENIILLVQKEEVFSGKAKIIHLEENKIASILSVMLLDKPLDVGLIFSIKKMNELKVKNIEEINFLRNFEKIDHNFKANVADLRYFLEGIKKTLDQNEIFFKEENESTQKMAEKSFLNIVGSQAFEKMDEILVNLNKNTKEFDEQEHECHKEYFQKQLHHLFLLSPFVKRAYIKPLGYPGDYQMMDMVYRDGDEGNSLFAKLINRYSSKHIAAAQASQNRIPYLVSKIERTAKRILKSKKAGVARIASIACGPVNEISEFLAKSSISQKCEFSLIDVEPEALYFSHEKIFDFKTFFGNCAKFNLINKSVKKLIQESRKTSPLPNQDLIYSAGLFEYLSDHTATKLIEVLFNFIAPKGSLIIGNFGVSNEFKCYMEYVSEWYLFHRTQEQLLSFSKGISSARKVYCESEKTGINHFLILEK